MRLRVGVAGCAAVTVLAGVLPGLLPSAAAAGCAPVRSAGAWTTVDFPLPTTDTSQVVVDAADPRRLFASDGSAVARSVDGGCTWTTVFGARGVDTSDLPSGATLKPAPAAPYYISDVVLPRAPRSKDVYLLLSPGSALQTVGLLVSPTPPPVLVARSTDGGASFSVQPGSADAGAVPRCNTATLAVAPSSTSTLYLACSGQVLLGNFAPLSPVSSTTEVIYRSTDGGGSWTRGEQKSLPNAPSHLDDLLVDPFDATHLYGRLMVYAPGPVLLVTESRDAGATWRTLYSAPPTTGDATMFGLDVSRPVRTAPARLVAWGPSGVVHSADGGARWTTVPTEARPQAVFAAAYDAAGKRLRVSTSSGTDCAAVATLAVFDVKSPGRVLSTGPVTLSPPAPSAKVVSLGTAGAATVAGVVRAYPAKGAPADAANCTVTPPAPPAPAPAAPSVATWKSVITLHTA